jgi:capsular polysaccharide transport system permease protein
MLRETKTLFGKHKLGYLWALISAMFQVGVFWAIRDFGGFHPPHGMSTPAFLLGGFIPYNIFSQSLIGGMNAVGGNKALLAYPQVFSLDIIVGRTALQVAMQSVVFILLLFLAQVLGESVTVIDTGAILIAFFAASLLGFGFGTLCSALNLMWPATSQIIPMLVRVLFFTSGLFFAVVDLPAKALDVIVYNPVSHFIVLTRSGFVFDYGENFVDLQYLFGFSVVILALGLLLERYSRHYLDRVI